MPCQLLLLQSSRVISGQAPAEANAPHAALAVWRVRRWVRQVLSDSTRSSTQVETQAQCSRFFRSIVALLMQAPSWNAGPASEAVPGRHTRSAAAAPSSSAPLASSASLPSPPPSLPPSSACSAAAETGSRQ